MAVILVANPGSSSRRYALYDGQQSLAELHFALERGEVTATLTERGEHRELDSGLPAELSDAGRRLGPTLLAGRPTPTAIALRIVAPSIFFQQSRLLDSEALARLEALQERAPIHITATLGEARLLQEEFPGLPIYGISDSSFHQTKSAAASHYGLPLEDAERLELYRYGYHGLSVASAVHALQAHSRLPARLIVCHLGSGASVTAVVDGQSMDNTMGYSPVEGLVMATRSGSLDPTAVAVLQTELGLDGPGIEEYLNRHSGLLGLSGFSAELPALLEQEEAGDPRAALALGVYVYRVRQGISQMAATLGGVDALALTGTVAERSPELRRRILADLEFLGLTLDPTQNTQANDPSEPTPIGRSGAAIYVVPARESAEMARQTQELIDSQAAGH